uniref:Uncharacterized protein n=1 Tax=Solanum lycopersicum TaxID=4081 RepID=A0A494GA96_SOLLC
MFCGLLFGGFVELLKLCGCGTVAVSWSVELLQFRGLWNCGTLWLWNCYRTSNSIRRRALDLLYGMCDGSNAKDIVEELLQVSVGKLIENFNCAICWSRSVHISLENTAIFWPEGLDVVQRKSLVSFIRSSLLTSIIPILLSTYAKILMHTQPPDPELQKQIWEIFRKYEG